MSYQDILSICYKHGVDKKIETFILSTFQFKVWIDIHRLIHIKNPYIPRLKTVIHTIHIANNNTTEF